MAKRTAVDARHSSINNEQFTPPAIIHAAGEVLERITLDPFSCEAANRLVGAIAYFDQRIDAFKQVWRNPDGTPSRVLANPPGGRVKNQSGLALGWRKTREEWEAGNVEEAIFIAFQPSILRICQDALDFPFCVPRERLHFWVDRDNPDFIESFRKKAEILIRQGKSSKSAYELMIDLHVSYVVRMMQDENKFVRVNLGDRDVILIESPHPPSDNLIFYFPPKQPAAWRRKQKLFELVFSKFGRVELKEPIKSLEAAKNRLLQ